MRIAAVVLGIVTCAVAFGTAALVASELSESQPTQVHLQTKSQSYAVGDTVLVDVDVKGSENAGSVRFRLRYNPEVLRFKAPAVEGTFLQKGDATTYFLVSDAEDGGDLTVGVARQGTGQGASGSGTLAKLAFEAINAGVAKFEFTNASLRSPAGDELRAAFKPIRLKVATELGGDRPADSP